MRTGNTSKSALVTGAGKRVGREIALHLARCGWDVAIHCRRSLAEAEAVAEEIRHLGMRAAVVQADLADNGEASALIERAEAQLGRLSLLVHNAAVFEKEGLSDFSHRRFTTHMAVNLEAPLHLTRDFAASAPAGSNVICLLDGMEGWGLSAAYLSYALSKRGLEEAVRLLARALAPEIRINGIAPGVMLPTAEEAEACSRIQRSTPLQRIGNCQEVLAAIDVILAVPGLTGQVINIANGMASPPLLAGETSAAPLLHE